MHHSEMISLNSTIAIPRAAVPSTTIAHMSAERSHGGENTQHKSPMTPLNKIKRDLASSRAMLCGRKRSQLSLMCDAVEYLLKLKGQCVESPEGQAGNKQKKAG